MDRASTVVDVYVFNANKRARLVLAENLLRCLSILKLSIGIN